MEADGLRKQRERDLIKAAQGGDLDAFGEIVRMYQGKVHWIAYNLTGNVEDAQDLSQEAFLRVFKALGRFKLQYNFYTWLYRIVVNLSIDLLRKRGKHQGCSLEETLHEPAASGGPVREFDARELGDEITCVLDMLPAKYKTVLVLRDAQGLACEEIAKIVGCTHATARWRLHKARELFKERWERQSRVPV